MSQNNQRQFYRELNHEGERCDYDQPDAEEMKKIWANIWSEVNVTKQEKVHITTKSLKKILGRMPNWKSLSPNLVQGFWLKNFSSLHGRVRSQLNECLDSGFVSSWLTKGKTALLQKDKTRGNIPSNYRPIKKTLWPLFMDGVQLSQGYKATKRKQFTFYHSVPRSFWYSTD